jgi:hypothetical protein
MGNSRGGGNQGGKKGSAKKQLPPINLGPPPVIQKKGHDTALFLAIVGVVAVPLVFVLQANGLVEVGWLPSLVIYAAIIFVFAWASLKWEVARSWSPLSRYGFTTVVCLALGTVSAFGVIKQYDKDHPPPLPFQITSFLYTNVMPPNISIGGIVWNDNYIDLSVWITNASSLDYSGMDIDIRPDQGAVEHIGQVSSVPNVTFIDSTADTLSSQLDQGLDGGYKQIEKDGKLFSGKRTSIKIKISPNDGYRLLCDKFPRNSAMEIVIAVDRKLAGVPFFRPEHVRLKGTFAAANQQHTLEVSVPIVVMEKPSWLR